ncbi:Male sterility protein [Popillia japonica]|uniref:Fatty acyl-CoA reductase n=1 Tax=Popillia japonica TaxID=7064 RepID=A0AAW1MCC3_POPJA
MTTQGEPSDAKETKELDTAKPADFSFKKLKQLTAFDVEQARATRIGRTPEKGQNHRFLTKAVWINNNKLTNVANLDVFLNSILEYPEKLGWLDLSFNYITHLDPILLKYTALKIIYLHGPILLKYTALKIIYLHGNKLDNFDEIKLLQGFPNLRSLTLHGNPISDIGSYRMSVLNTLPQLVNLDFTPASRISNTVLIYVHIKMSAESLVPNSKSEIQEFYNEKTVFVSGASGFLGKLLIEKLLRTCKGLKRIYILLREKKGKTPEDRFKEIFDIPAFEKLKSDQPNFLSKISILGGDLVLPNLGLSESHQEILKEEVNCIFHAGATVRFDEKLLTAAYINVRCVRDLLRIAKDMKQLQSFVHISTAYANCTHPHIDEAFYEPPMAGNKFLELVELLDERVLDEITPTLLQNYPNTYAFTKSLAEGIVKHESKGLPLVVVRPSIVISTYHDPTPGWVDNIYGTTLTVQLVALGVLRTFHLPADLVVNTIILAAWEAANNNNNVVANGNGPKYSAVPQIYNVVSRPQNPITWGKFRDLVLGSCSETPTSLLVWHPTFHIHSNYYVHNLIALFAQKFPAYLINILRRCVGKKPSKFIHAIRRVDKYYDICRFATLNEWSFNNTNTQNLWRKLNTTDKEMYNCDVASVDWDEMFSSYIRGVRMYLLNDPIGTLGYARRKALVLKFGHYMLIIIVCFMLYKLFMLLIWFIIY